METRLAALLLTVSLLICGCSRRPKSVRYEYLGTGQGNPKAAPILVAVKAIFADIQDEDWSGLHEKMTPSAGLRLPQPQLAAQCEMVCKRFGVPASVEILEIHLGEFPKRPANVPAIAKIGVEGRSEVLPNPVRIASPVSGRAAIVLGKCTARSSGLKSWITIVLHGVESGWGMVNLHMNGCEANGHDGRWYINRAEELGAQGFRRNAFLYRNFGAQLLMPGPYILARPASQILERSAKTEPPANLPFPGVRPSETWRTDEGDEFAVELVWVVSAPSFFTLEIRYKTDQKELDSEEVRAKRRRLFDYVRQRFPEYQEGFDGIFIGSQNAVGSGFREYFPFDQKDDDATQ
ncbi:MAG: hypothetical protein ACYSWQ_13335 [Planctomycetota bacterium]